MCVKWPWFYWHKQGLKICIILNQSDKVWCDVDESYKSHKLKDSPEQKKSMVHLEFISRYERFFATKKS